MFSLVTDNLDLKVNTTDKKIKELSIEYESIDREIKDFYEEFSFDPNTFEESLNFTQEQQLEFEQQKAQLQSLLKNKMDEILNPSKTKDTYKEKSTISNQWLPVP